MRKPQHLTQIEKELINVVSKKRLMEYTREVTKEVRLSGSAEELRAFEYAKEQLDSFGLETELLFSENYISVPGKANLIVDKEPIDCITHSMSKPVNNFQSEIIYVGNGTDDDYKNKNIREKTVLVRGLATPDGVRRAERHGAVAAIFINGDYTHEMIVSPVWGSPTLENIKYLPSIPVLSVNQKNGEKIRQFISKEKNHCEISTEVITEFREIPTLISEIRGSVEPDQFVLLSGHIDSWHYGVMDNGTANATMIEIARVLSRYKSKLNRTLRIAFWSGHSHGRYAGSTWYCDNYWEDLYENCILHINVDSVGAKGATVLTNADCMKETKDLAYEVIYNLTGEEFKGSRHGRSGDHSFWGTGTPSLFMGLSEQEPSNAPSSIAFQRMFNSPDSGGFGWWWHTAEDTIDKIDPDFLKRDCEIYLLTVYKSLTDKIIPINQYEAVKDIERALHDWQEKASGLFDLSSSINRAYELKENAKKFIDLIAQIDVNAEDKVSIINQTIMDLSKILVPLNYVRGSIYEHDFALTQPAVPILSEIEKLTTVSTDSDEFKFLINSLVRKRNKVNYDLKMANGIIKNAFYQL